MLLNQVLLAVAPIPLIMGVLSIWVLTWVETALATLSLLIIIPALWLNAKKKFAVARWVVTLGFILYISAYILIFGRELGASPTYLTISLMVMVLFGKNLDRWILFSFILVCLIFTEYYQHAYAPLLPIKMNYFSYTGTLLSNFIAIVAIVWFFSSEQRKLLRSKEILLTKLQSSNERLEEKNRQIALQNETLSGLNKELEQFAYACSHHFKTPLRSIHSFMGLVETQLEEKEIARVRIYLDYAKESSLQLYELTQNLLDFIRLSSPPEAKKQISLPKVLKDIRRNLYDQMEEKKVEVVFDELPDVWGHEFHFQLLFQNLIENGLKYNDSIIPRVSLSYSLSPESLRVVVKDNGIGVSEEFKDSIFDMFARLHTADQFEGTGLGLAICRKIIFQYEGRIEIENNPEGGSSFILYFPRAIIIPTPQASALDHHT